MIRTDEVTQVQEGLLLSQRTQVQVLEPISNRSQPPVTPVPADLTFTGLSMHPHTCGAHELTQARINTHTDIHIYVYNVYILEFQPHKMKTI